MAAVGEINFDGSRAVSDDSRAESDGSRAESDGSRAESDGSPGLSSSMEAGSPPLMCSMEPEPSESTPTSEECSENELNNDNDDTVLVYSSCASPPPLEEVAVPTLEGGDEEQEEDDDVDDNLPGSSYDCVQDPVCQVMDFLNFAVVPRKPNSSLFETPLPAGEIMSKSQHIEEKKTLLELLKGRNKEMIQAQVEKRNAELKAQDMDKRMKLMVKIVAELHGLYGRFVQSLVLLLTKGQNRPVVRDGEHASLTIGPFRDVRDVDQLLCRLSGLSNQLNNEFESLSKTRRILSETIEFICEKTQVELPFATGAPAPEEESGSALNIGVVNDQSSSATATVEEVDGESVNDDSGLPTLYDDDSTVTASFTTPVLEGVASPIFAIVPAVDDTTLPPTIIPVGDTTTTNSIPDSQEEVNANATMETGQSSDDTNSDNVHVPIVGPQQYTTSGSKTLYTMVEYPGQPNPTQENHDMDRAKWRNHRRSVCLCGREFSSVTILKYHIRYFNAKWKFVCSLCRRKYPGYTFLKMHMLRQHKIIFVGTNACQHCSKSFHTAGELLRHLQQEHNKHLPSEVIQLPESPGPSTSQGFGKKGRLSQDCTTQASEFSQRAIATPSTSFSSSRSSGTFTDSQSLLIVHGTRCACGAELGTREALIAHIRAEVKAHDSSFKCNLCKINFKHPCSLKSHFLEHHGVPYQDYQERQFGCSWCETMFESYDDLGNHLNQVHHMEHDLPIKSKQRDPPCATIADDDDDDEDNNGNITTPAEPGPNRGISFSCGLDVECSIEVDTINGETTVTLRAEEYPTLTTSGE